MSNVTNYLGSWVINRTEGVIVKQGDLITIEETSQGTADQVLVGLRSLGKPNPPKTLAAYAEGRLHWEMNDEESGKAIAFQAALYEQLVDSNGQPDPYRCLYGVAVKRDPEDVAVFGAEETGG